MKRAFGLLRKKHDSIVQKCFLLLRTTRISAISKKNLETRGLTQWCEKLKWRIYRRKGSYRDSRLTREKIKMSSGTHWVDCSKGMTMSWARNVAKGMIARTMKMNTSAVTILQMKNIKEVKKQGENETKKSIIEPRNLLNQQLISLISTDHQCFGKTVRILRET